MGQMIVEQVNPTIWIVIGALAGIMFALYIGITENYQDISFCGICKVIGLVCMLAVFGAFISLGLRVLSVVIRHYTGTTLIVLGVLTGLYFLIYFGKKFMSWHKARTSD